MSLTTMPTDNCRLTKEQYDKLVMNLGGAAQPVVTKDSTPEEISYRLGVQFVLTRLRDGWSTTR